MANKKSANTRQLGEVLVEMEFINPSQLQHALRIAGERDVKLGEVLVELGLIEENELAQALARRLDISHIDLDREESLVPTVLRLIPEELARKKHLVAAYVTEGDDDKPSQLVVAMSNPTDEEALKEVEAKTGLKPVPAVTTISQIDAALESAYREPPESLSAATSKLKEHATQRTPDRPVETPFHHTDDAPDTPAVRYINSLLYEAIKSKASDIHIEPQEFSTRIRLRIDGVLNNVPAPPREYQRELVSRLKIISGLDIAERRLPQSGSLRMRFAGRSVDARVSTMPGVTGEKIVVRILDKGRIRLDVERLGFQQETVSAIRQILKSPHGIFLLCGPTGCGKTTTMYSFINELNNHTRNIVTVEDPVEYHIPGTHQTHVRAGIGLTFAECLRTLLRQDPDIVMVGEIRDLDTLQVAVRAALTGHPVFSTLHTNTAVSSITRMTNMGLKRYLASATLNAALSQQLVRKVCPHCATKQELAPNAREEVEAYFECEVDFDVPRINGCEHCNYTGYLGRIAVEELFVVDDKMREIISNHDSEAAMTDYARARGMKTLIEHGFEKLKSGITSAEEIMSLGFRWGEHEPSTPASQVELLNDNA